jgi:hypothetical protein
MNIKDNILFFIATFPVFITRSNFEIIEISGILLFYSVLLILNFFFLTYLKNKSIVANKIYISLIATYGLDNHLGLFNGLIQPNLNYIFKFFSIVYIPAFIIFILLFLIIFLIIYKLNKENSIKILLATIITLIIFNLFDDTKHHKQINYFEKNISKKFDRSTIILIFDEMSGLNSLSSESLEGKIVNKNFIKLFDKYNFNYYPDIFSISDNTVTSLSSLINFNTKLEKDKREKFIKSSKNYFTDYDIKQNKLFHKYKSISVIQNMHINFCNNPNVKSCYQFNPFDLNMISAETSFFSKIISNWNLNGSIFAKFFWRSLKQLELIDSTLEPEGEKKFINDILNYSLGKVNSKKYDLIFLHVLVPHVPYGFDTECKYKTKISNLNLYLTEKDKINQHNIERNCVINILDKFLEKINNIEDHKIFILSDHGSRITNEKKSSLSTIFAFKNFGSKTSYRLNEKNMHKEFKVLNNE